MAKSKERKRLEAQLRVVNRDWSHARASRTDLMAERDSQDQLPSWRVDERKRVEDQIEVCSELHKKLTMELTSKGWAPED